MLWAPDPFNRRTGKLLGYNYYQKFSDYDPEKGGDYFRRTMRQPGKKMLTEEGQAFANWIKALGEEVDPLTPWLIKQFKDGNIGLSGEEVWVKSDSGDTQTVSVEEAEQVFNKFAVWYNATDSPHRQGRNIQEMSLEDVNTAAAQHHAWVQEQETERERREKLEETFQNLDQEVVYRWPDGWTVKRLNTSDDLRYEGDAMGHCIGNDDQPYCDALENGDIEAYSLRDPSGIPHATWHYNPDGSLAQLQGTSGHTPKEEYQQRFIQWSEEEGKPTDAVGDANLYDEDYVLPIMHVNSVLDILGDYSYESLRDWAIDHGANFNPNADYSENIEVDIYWDLIVKELIESHPAINQQEVDAWNQEWGYALKPGEGTHGIDYQRRTEEGPQPNLFDFPPTTKRFVKPREKSMDQWVQSFNNLFAAIGNETYDRADLGLNIELEFAIFENAIRSYQPKTPAQQQAQSDLIAQIDEKRYGLTDPETGEVDWDWANSSYYEESDWPMNEWNEDPQNVPPLWIDKDIALPNTKQFAIPWWYSEPNSPYSEETFMPSPEYDEKKKIWNKASAEEINQWDSLGQPSINPDQKVLPGMCPNCGSAEYEVGWELPTKTIQKKWDMAGPDPEHPFSSGWYFYCPDCGYYEGYTGPAGEARENQLPQLEESPGYKWDSRARRFRRLNPDPVNDPLLYGVDNEAYQRARERYERQNPRRRWIREPTIEDHVIRIERGRGAPTSDKGRQDPFYNWAKDLIQDAFDTNPNVNIKQPNFKSVLKRNVQGAQRRDYTSRYLIDFAQKTNQLPELQQAADEVAKELDAILAVAPNHLGNDIYNCKCPTCNRQRGQRERWKERYAIKAIKKEWRQNIRGERGQYRKERWLNAHPEFEGLGYREIMRQEPSQEEINYAIENNRTKWNYINVGLTVKHDYDDWTDQWHEYFVSVGLAKPEDSKGSDKTWEKFWALANLKDRAEWVSSEIEKMKNPSTPSDPSQVVAKRSGGRSLAFSPVAVWTLRLRNFSQKLLGLFGIL